ncbi:FAD-dependent monooxygenase [Dietzia cercidiphylli]|uniref:FAD-dependent monooxygenase n=1 Tax=Dietzia cercidiphylli TaxID=498199 RepID=UPI00223AB515|nr:FAD-dependent monooxygenase [Dietzia cercidiphylli]MCT1514530.1 FAD-dependent monooxygenase [Dietzia cercidiphylli]
MPDTTTDIVIVGAGIGGLAAAATLRARGMRVTVLEQADRLGEIGAGLQIGPNASRVLYRLGLSDGLAGCALHAQESVRRRWSTGEILTKTTLGAGATAKFGAPYLHLHRADLHKLLLDAATAPAGAGEPVRVEVASHVTGIDDSDPTRPAVLTHDGRTFPGDVIIGADGINSRIRRASGGPTAIVDSGDMAYRTLIPADRAREDEATRWLFDWPAANFWLGDNRHVVVYPVRDMQYVNVVAVVPITDQVRSTAKAEVPAEEMRQHYEGWDPRLTRLLGYSDDRVMAWALNYQEPFTPWSTGHVALLGDACHSMLPYFSQGASQAIEDAAVIAEELAKAERGLQSIPSALSAYTERRAERAAAVQRGAVGNRALFHLPDGPEQRRRDERFREHHKESDISFDWIYAGTPLDDETPLVTAG